MKTKLSTALSAVFSVMLSVFAFFSGLGGGVMMAQAAGLPDAGKTRGDNSLGANGKPLGNGGIATETYGREDGDPEFYSKQIDERIIKIRPMATPVDQISRHAKAQNSNSFEVKYYSVGTRPIMCKVKNAIAADAMTGDRITLEVDDVNMFTIDDTIRVVGVKAVTDAKGKAYSKTDAAPDLILHVCGVNSNSGMPQVYAVNGGEVSGQTIKVPEIKAGTVLIRMGKACGELDVQTGRFNNLPTAEIQYCQNFMLQIEQSTFDKLAAKEVNWSFSDIEEDGIYDMRLGMENTFLFGDKRVIKHKSKDNMATWFTGGIWWMAGKDLELGRADNGKTVVSDDDLVDLAKDLFVGTGVGNKRKILFCGSDMLAALSKIQSEKFRLKDSVDVWSLKFKSWDTDFGEILAIHHELFDANNMKDCGFALDPDFLCKRTHVSWARNILDLKTAGVRNTEAVVLQEVSCLYLRYAKAHARIKLAKPTTTA